MSLTLTITNADHLDNGEPTQLRLDRHGAAIGRSPHSDWSLPDPKSYISSTHCEIDYRDGAYLLVDKSTNGTFLNGSAQRLAGPQPLKDGDVITIGHYRVAVSGAGGAASAAVSATTSAPASGGGAGWGGWGAAAAPTPPASSWDAPAAHPWDAANAPASPAPPLAPPPAGVDAGGWATAPAAPSGSSGWSDAAAPPAAGWAAADADAPEADAWSSAPSAAPAADAWGAPPRSPPPPAPAPSSWDAPGAPDAGSAWGAAGAGPAKPPASGWDPLAPARDAAAADAGWGAQAAAAAPVSGRGALSANWTPPRVDAPAAPAQAAASAMDVWGAMEASNTVDWSRGGFGAPLPSTAPAAAPGGDAAWAALLSAAGVSGADLKAPPVEAAATAGALLKRVVAGLVVMMEARARAKAQLGAQSTTLELKGNNPLKFARSPERVLQQLLNPPERGFMGAADAVEDSFRDLQAHQMATLAAMQGALRATLDRFSPEAIRKRAEMRGVLARILPAARNATLWEAYEREFEGVAKGSDEAFMDVFAKAFKEAYERTAAQMKAQAK